MRRVFADTLYWVALIDSKDPWRARAVRAAAELGKAHLVTTDAVLLETVNALSASGPHMRRQVACIVHGLLSKRHVEVIPQGRDLFLCGLEFHQKRPDKEYSLTDCISMLVMRQKGLREALTNDHHFEQEGFIVLIPSR